MRSTSSRAPVLYLLALSHWPAVKTSSWPTYGGRALLRTTVLALDSVWHPGVGDARLTYQTSELQLLILLHRRQTDHCLNHWRKIPANLNQIPYLPAFTPTPLFPFNHSLKQPVHPYHLSTESSSIGRLYVKKNSHAASITNKASNSSAKKACPSSDLLTILQ